MPTLRTNRRTVNYQVPDENDRAILLGGNKDWIRYRPRGSVGDEKDDNQNEDSSSKHSKSSSSSSSSSASKSNNNNRRHHRNPLQTIQRGSQSPLPSKSKQQQRTTIRQRQGRSKPSSTESTMPESEEQEEEYLSKNRTGSTQTSTTTTRHRNAAAAAATTTTTSTHRPMLHRPKQTARKSTTAHHHRASTKSTGSIWAVGTRCAVEYVEDHAYLNSQRAQPKSGHRRGANNNNKKQNPIQQTNHHHNNDPQKPPPQRSFTYWHPGTIFQVESNHVWVRFDDQSTERIPKKDVRILISSSSSSTRSDIKSTTFPTTTWYFASDASTGERSDIVFGQCPPVQPLEVGDLVQVHFQNGRYCADAYYVGRVAAVPRNGGVSVAYQDGDYEEHIPNHAITLLQKGIEHPQFLLGLTVARRTGSSSSSTSRGVIVRADPNQPVHIQFPSTRSGTTATEIVQRSYPDIVQAVFQAARQTIQPTVCQWPVVTEQEEEETEPLKITHRSSSVSSSKRQPPSSKCTHHKRVKRSSKTIAPSEDETVSSDDEYNHDDSYQEENEEEESPQPMSTKRAARKSSTRPSRAAANMDATSGSRGRSQSRTVSASTTSMELEDATTAVPEDPICHTVSHFLEAQAPSQRCPRPFQPMYPAFSNIFGKALNSADCHVGLQMLTFVYTMHDQVPNDDLWNQLVDMITYGPKSGSVYFPDSAKMIAVMQYMRLMLSLDGQVDRCCEILDRECFRASHGGLSYPELVLSHLSTHSHRFYMAEGDEYRTNHWAVGRIEQSLHVRICLAELFLHLLKHQLQPYVRRERTGESCPNDEEEEDSHAYRDRPIIRHIVHARRGAKDALEKAVVAGIQHWLSYGHFVTLTDLSRFHADANPPSLDSLDCLRGRIISLAEQQGLIISCLAWLYGKEANEDTFALADLIARILDREISTWATPSVIANRIEYLREIKLQFIGNVEPSLCPQLRPKLAERLDVVILYNIIYAP